MTRKGASPGPNENGEIGRACFGVGVGFSIRQAQDPEPVEGHPGASVADVEIGDHLSVRAIRERTVASTA